MGKHCKDLQYLVSAQMPTLPSKCLLFSVALLLKCSLYYKTVSSQLGVTVQVSNASVREVEASSGPA